MRDEFCQPKELNTVSEMNTASEFSENTAKEFWDVPPEKLSAKEFFKGGEDGEQQKKQTSKDKLGSGYKKLRKMGYMVAATVSVAVVTQSVYPDFSILPKEDPAPVMESEVEPEMEEPAVEESLVVPQPEVLRDKADASFPKLGNLMPNLNPVESGFAEQYLIVSDGTQYYCLYQDAAGLMGEISTYPGMQYDFDTNTLTLNNCTAPVIVSNMMGNGFTIELVGENHIEAIQSWGYKYGGSVRFTGSGSLKVNEGAQFNIGIFLLAENSESAIMLDGTSEVEIWGTEAAVYVSESTCEKGIYFLEPFELEGMKRFEMQSQSAGKDFTIVDENEDIVKHVVFSE
ncbi:MAG: hypothetical protein ACI4EX_03140 [Lachnospiraceae bacterium]